MREAESDKFLDDTEAFLPLSPPSFSFIIILAICVTHLVWHTLVLFLVLGGLITYLVKLFISNTFDADVMRDTSIKLELPRISLQ